MELIIGGAYQGKHQYLRDSYGALPPEQLVDTLHLWVLEQLRQGNDPLMLLQNTVEHYRDAVVICEDIFCGVVPTDPLERRWREETGRCVALLSARADRVTRLFCGIPTRLKG